MASVSTRGASMAMPTGAGRSPTTARSPRAGWTLSTERTPRGTARRPREPRRGGPRVGRCGKPASPPDQRIDPPLARQPLQLVGAAIFEDEIRALDEVARRSREEDLV